MKTKGEHVNSALRKLRISGITVDPSGSDLTDSLEELEDMVHEYNGTIKTNYNFETSINASTLSGIDDEFNDAIAWSLALRLTDMFGKQPTQNMSGRAASSMQNWRARTSKTSQIAPPRTMPVGSGNQLIGLDTNNFYYAETAPVTAQTIYASVGDIVDGQFSLDTWLNGLTITSQVTTVSTGATLVSSSFLDSIVSFRASLQTAGFINVCSIVTRDDGLVTTVNTTIVVSGECNV